MLTKKDAVTVGIPPAMKDRYVVRIVDAKFGLSKSSQNPMVTMKVEVVGVPTPNGIEDTISRGGKTYSVAGIQLQPIYYPLVAGKALGRFVSFLDTAELPSEEIDDENHDCSVYKGLEMEALVSSYAETQKKILSDEERAEGKVEGDPILDNEGKPITKELAVLTEWICKHNG